MFLIYGLWPENKVLLLLLLLIYQYRYVRCSPSRLPSYEHVFHKTVEAKKYGNKDQRGVDSQSGQNRKMFENVMLSNSATAVDINTVSTVMWYNLERLTLSLVYEKSKSTPFQQYLLPSKHKSAGIKPNKKAMH